MKQNPLDGQCLVLNKHFIPCNAFTVRQAVSQMAAGASCGVSITDGGFEVVPWERWVDLECREFDGVLHTKFKSIRCPTVVVCTSYHKIPKKQQKFTLANIARRDGYRDQYTGEVLEPHEWSQDHVEPRGKGGENVPENVVLQRKKDNNRKGCRTPEQAGLKRPVVRPLLPQTPVETITMTHPDHALFVKQFKKP